MPLRVVQACDFAANGQCHYRYHEPSRALARLGAVVVDCDPLHRHLPHLAEAADVLVLQCYDWEWLPVIERRRAQGKATVVEASDHYFDTQPWNAGSLAWDDPLERECLRRMLAAADAVQTTTAELASVRAPWARRVAVFANQLSAVPPLAPRREWPLTIGWAGSGSHLADWYACAPFVQSWLDANPEIHLAVMTDERGRAFVRIPSERYHFRQSGGLAEYLTFLRSIDIGLSPLLPSEFNRCRSDLKYLEYAAHGVAGIYSDYAPFREHVRDGENGLLIGRFAELPGCLDALIADPGLRERIRRNAYTDVSANRILRDHANERLRFYESLTPLRSGEFPAELLAGAVRDGDYHQLRQGSPERALAASIRRPADPAALAGVIAEHPGYAAALAQSAFLCNEAGEPAEALDLLDRALAVEPDGCRALCEAARSLLALGDLPAARLCLDRVLEINPAHPLAWKHLAAAWPEAATDAAEMHPTSHTFALAALPGSDALHRLIDEHSQDTRPAVAAAFSDAIARRVDLLDASEALALLCRAAETFPHSARLAALYGRALEVAGRQTAALAQFERALAIRRAAEVWRLEFAADDPLLKHCQVAEYAARQAGQ